MVTAKKSTQQISSCQTKCFYMCLVTFKKEERYLISVDW
jgi:hypothetical protein